MATFGFTDLTLNQDPTLGGLRMQFVQFVDYAPMAIRASALRHVGGIDEGMSRRGSCGICELK